MRSKSPRISVGLCALGLAAGLTAQGAAPVITNLTVAGGVVQFGVESELGLTKRIQCCANLGQPEWEVLTNLVVSESPYWFVDAGAAAVLQRFYRVEALAGSAPPPPGMVLIPAGSFTMGATTNMGHEYYSGEVPQHTVYVSAFYMDKYEVTKALWEEVYQWAITNGYSFEYGAQGKAANHPAQSMTWYDCVKWCNARSEKEGRTPAYYMEAGQATVYRTGQVAVQNDWVKWDAGYRLPTEAEWEKAARGGVSGHRFPWSDTDNSTHSRANYYSFSFYSYDTSPTRGYHPTFNDGVTPYTSPVGCLGGNGYGLYDMAGNVWEWCWDWYSSGYYSSSPGTDPRGPSWGWDTGWARVVRGGGWYDYARDCRTARRYEDSAPDSRDYRIGFRSVRASGQ